MNNKIEIEFKHIKRNDFLLISSKSQEFKFIDVYRVIDRTQESISLLTIGSNKYAHMTESLYETLIVYRIDPEEDPEEFL